MRIVGGEWKSRRLRPPEVGGLRPTSDRLREALFDILGPAVAAGGFVDAYAGTGAVGLEAFSRGARPVVWVEAASAVAALVRANLAAFGAGADPQAVVMARHLPQAVSALARLPLLRAAGGAQTLFLDPPYDDSTAVERLLRVLDAEGGVLCPGAQVIAETRWQASLPERVGRWQRQRLHRQGSSQLAFFRAANI
ncbi:MAG: 16S rRNA (guanine(966)-N(2))-methyltransferase RsmD [Terriglobales bacterium]